MADLSDQEFVKMSSGLNDVYYKGLPILQIDEKEFMTDKEKE